MKISDAGLDLVKRFEGYHDRLPDGSCRAYLDKLAKPHVPTIGYGCTRGVKMGMVWTHEQAEAALRDEIATFEAAVAKLVTVDLNQNEFDSLVSFSYNVGSGALGSSTLLKKLNAGDRRGAAGEFKRWNKAGGAVWPGLVDRRAREATLFLTPAGLPGEPAMPQAVEEGPAKATPATVATVATTAGAAAGQIIPAPPAEITESVTQLSVWQSIISTGHTLAVSAWEHWPLVLGLVATVGALTWWNRRITS